MATKTKAKTVRRWVARESRAPGGYLLFVGPKPRRHKKRWDDETTDVKGFVAWQCPTHFERFCPEWLHLNPGEGPVEIRIVKVKAVKP